MSQKVCYGLGQIADSLALQSPKQIGNTFYVVLLGVNPAWVGTVLALIRLWDAITDPLAGWFSDRLRGRYGRRKPMILVGGFAMAVLFPTLWLASPAWAPGEKIAWFSGSLLCFYVGYTIFSLPYQAMGLELLQGYHQRTSVQAYRAFFGASSNIILWWALPLAFVPWFGDGVTGMRWVSTAMGLLILGCALLPLLVKTPDAGTAAAQAPVRASWRTAIGNRSLRLLVGAVGATFLGINLTHGLSGLLNVYFVHAGDVAASTIVTGFYGTTWTISSVLATPLAARLSVRFGKRETLVGCIAVIAAGSLLQLGAFVPTQPYLQIVPVLLLSPGVAGLWVVGPSMLADVCDDDRARHGARREASLTALYTWVQKCAFSLSFAASGFLTVWAGFDVSREAAQDPGVFDALRRTLALAPFLALVPAGWFAWRYPITEAVARANRARLEAGPNGPEIS